MNRQIQVELAGQAKALRLLARMLVDGDAAEDLVQDTTLAALQSPPKERGALRHWLITVMRRLASNHRRGESRRKRHEGMVPHIGPERQAEQSAARVADRHEAVQRVTEAVLGLPEPYHGTLLLRFFEDLTPTAIAERTGVPLATVKSRLQRGLQLMRERLERSEIGGDWRSAFALAFGIHQAGRVATVAAVTGTGATGVAVMASATKLAVGGVLILVAAATATWMWRDPVRVGEPPQAEFRTSSAAMAVGVEQPEAVAEAGRLAPERDLAPVVSAGTSDARTTLRGRCVDAAGQPIVAVTVDLSGRAGTRQRMTDWTSTHAEPERVHEKVTSGIDGGFELCFWPPPPFEFSLRLGGTGLAAWGRDWDELPVGGTVDLGDVTMVPGTLVRGRVVDSEGAPVAKLQVDVGHGERPETGGFDRWAVARTRDDGSFQCSCALVAGDYELRVMGRDVERPERVTLAGKGDEQFVDIVLTALDLTKAISGIVVDEACRRRPGSA